MRCGQCGASLGDGDRFCGGCGAPSGGCPSCGEPVTPGDRFCRACGSVLPDARAAGRVPGPGTTPSAAAGPNAEPVAERRVCSVLFCDVVGFTPLSESRDPEAVRELLSEYFEMARTVVNRYGGVVEKFIGDAVMAVWGTPVATEGDAERAVRAALDLVTADRSDRGGRRGGRAGLVGSRGGGDRRGRGDAGRDRPGDGGRRRREHRRPGAGGGRTGPGAGGRGDVPAGG